VASNVPFDTTIGAVKRIKFSEIFIESPHVIPESLYVIPDLFGDPERLKT